jgi:hypothetical protein
MLYKLLISLKQKKLRVLIFAKGQFLDSARKLENHLLSMGVSNVILKTNHDLPNDFNVKHKKILGYNKGYGYCIWKPYLISEQLKIMNQDEILLYIDSTDRPSKRFLLSFLNTMNKRDLFLINRGFMHASWTRRDTFVLMGCDSEEYHDKVQLEAGIIGLKKTNFSMNFIQEWYEYCSNEQILCELPQISGLPNIEPFFEHRYDQSILTNLQIKYNIDHRFIGKSEVEFNYFQPENYI